MVIPALNEEKAVGLVVSEVPARLGARVVVVDNASEDATAAAAIRAGAEVVREARRGYGRACLAGIAHLRRTGPPEVVVFLDADRSDHPREMVRLVAPVLAGKADLVIGSRVLGRPDRGALLPQARWGNALATLLIRMRWGVRFTDLGPFRAMRWEALDRLEMSETNFGWTAQMQVRAARFGLRCEEVPVSYRRRLGRSKITGTLRGTLGAGSRILWVIGREALGRAAR